MEEKYDIDILKEILSEKGNTSEIQTVSVNTNDFYLLTKDSYIKVITFEEYNLKKSQKREQKINQILNDE